MHEVHETSLYICCRWIGRMERMVLAGRIRQMNAVLNSSVDAGGLYGYRYMVFFAFIIGCTHHQVKVCYFK